MATSDKQGPDQLIEERLKYLEEVNRGTVDALDLAASLGDFQTSISKFESAELILREASARVQKLMSFRATSFLLVDEEFSEFQLAFCDPVDYAADIEREKETLVEKRIFSWALNRMKPVFVFSESLRAHLLLHVITTSSRVRGMFIGVLATDVQEISDSTLRLTSIVMLNVANALESYELYKWVNNINTELKEKVAELAASEQELQEHRLNLEDLVVSRTKELKLANERLKDEVNERLKAEKALRMAHDELEQRVETRTAELREMNLSLQAEINERRRVQDELLRAKDYWEDTFDAISDLVMLMDNDQRVVRMNRAGADMLDCSKRDLLGKKCFEVVHGQDTPIKDCPLGIVRNTLEPVTREIFEPSLGKTFLCSIAPIIDDQGEVNGYIHSLKDITEAKSLEAKFLQAQKMEAIGTLAGGIAHDFNNLLMGIQGNAALILMEIDSYHSHYERLKNVEKLAQSGASLTRHLLGYARKGKYEAKAIDLNKLVTEVLTAFDRTRKEITSSLDLSEGLSSVEVDSGQIEQVLLNLFINAADAMPDGGKLTLRTRNSTHEAMSGAVYAPMPGDYVMLKVTDNGTGMAPDTLERIFDPFFTTKEMGRGTGLGLASVYGIIKGHNGYINVESKEGQGTTFSIFLPASKLKTQADVEKADKVKKAEGTEVVLLVDDEDFILDVGRSMLQLAGYRVLIAANGAEALDVYRENKDDIAIVVLDMVMPDMGGGEAYDRLKEIDPEVNVLLSSGYSIEGQATGILERGCKGFIQKPFNISELSLKIGTILGR